MTQQRWKYKDTTGVEREGFMQRFDDQGGTDVGYWFIRDDGRLDIVRGSRLKDARNITREYMQREVGENNDH